jgi:hypothetical protein
VVELKFRFEFRLLPHANIRFIKQYEFHQLFRVKTFFCQGFQWLRDEGRCPLTTGLVLVDVKWPS